MAGAALTFVVGYMKRCKRTPEAMGLVYGAMASLCAYQTFFILDGRYRFHAMPSSTSST